MSGGPFLNIKAPKELLDRLDDYRFAARKPSRAEAARELLDTAPGFCRFPALPTPEGERRQGQRAE